MEKQKIKCSLSGHEKIDAISFCQKCNIYMCTKCHNMHSELLKFHQISNLNKAIDEIFSGICKIENHENKLEFFCKTHNVLFCLGCISKIKNKNYGQHTDCEICIIDDIQEEKKNKLKENISCLEYLSNSLEQSINDLKKTFDKINENRENIKLKIQKIFTKIRNAINEREEELLSEVDKKLGELFFDDNLINKSIKLPNKIKRSLASGKEIDKAWKNEKLNNLINNCINIEKNIEDINMITENIEKYNSRKKIEIKISPPNEYKIYSILETIKSFCQIYYNNFRYSFVKIDSSNSKISGSNLLDINRPMIKTNISISNIYEPVINIPGLDIPGPKIKDSLNIFEKEELMFKIPEVELVPEIDLFQANKNNNLNENILIDNGWNNNLIIDSKIGGESNAQKQKKKIFPKVDNISTPIIDININNKRIYKITGEKDNIVTKTGENNNWMGTICINELKSSEENIWKIKILETRYKYIMVGVAPIDFDINSSIYNYGWYLFCYDSTLYSGPPHNYLHKETNLDKVQDEIKIIMNMKQKTLKFIIGNVDKGESFSNIPIDIPISPAILMYNTDDSLEILENDN